MADPSTYRPKTSDIPTNPGVYKFKDPEGRVVYVGKAKNLRARLTSYFQDFTKLHMRTQNMVTTANQVEWTIVGTEIEALTLEYTWIKKYDPRFNVKYKDDKSYPYLAVTLSEEIPRAIVTRGDQKKGNRYFGPYAKAWAIRETLDLLLRVFPIRTCSNGVYSRAQLAKRPCLLGYIDKCAAPCVERISPEDHRELAKDFCTFLSGNASVFLKDLKKEMYDAAKQQDYEKAARIRDNLQALESVLEKNAVVFQNPIDTDIFAFDGDELEVSVQVFHVRKGRLQGQRWWEVEKVADLDDAELLEQLIIQVYGIETEEKQEQTTLIPKEILVPQEPQNLAQLEIWLSELKGTKVEIKVPQRGAKKELLATVHTNAREAFMRHKIKRSSDLTTRSQGLKEIQEYLGLEKSPLRIECYDISHTQGSYQSASMVVFEDGLARKDQYRNFVILHNQAEGTSDDIAAIREVIERRIDKLIEEQDQPSEKRFSYQPNLIVVDGGPGQVAAAQEVLDAYPGLEIAVCGLAKRLEEVWLPGEDFPVIFPRTSHGLYLLQRLRDEAHRFAITQHRRRRSKGMLNSELDKLNGIGKEKSKALMKHFGSLKKLKAASLQEIEAVPGFGKNSAKKLYDQLHPGKNSLRLAEQS